MQDCVKQCRGPSGVLQDGAREPLGPCWGLTLRRGAREKSQGISGNHLSVVSHDAPLVCPPSVPPPISAPTKDYGECARHQPCGWLHTE